MKVTLKSLAFALVISGASFSGATVLAQDPTQQPAPIVPGNAATGDAPAANASKADVSYLLGFDSGSNLVGRRLSDKDVDIKEFMTGFTDALSSKEIRIQPDQIESVVATVRALFETKMRQLAQENLEKSKKYLDENKVKDGVQTTKSGLQYQVIKSGSGAQPSISDIVSIHYEGKTIDGVVFDSSIERGAPAQFPVGRLVPGFSEALQRMKVGDKWIVTIPPDLGYAEEGSPGAIGPNEVLIFNLELLNVEK